MVYPTGDTLNVNTNQNITVVTVCLGGGSIYTADID